MLNPEYPNFEKKSLDDLDLALSEPIKKINVRGKKKEFFTKVGKILSIILPIEPNTSSSNQQFNALWLSPDEWLVYFNEENNNCLLYTSPSPRDSFRSRMPSSA